MGSLLSVEWLKIKKYRTFWILISLFMVLLFLWNYGINAGFVKMGAGDINILSQAYSFPYVWNNLGFWASIFVIFQAILAIILTTNEYQYRTNRQHVIDGWNRMQFFHAKWLMALMLSIGTTLFVLVLGLFFGIYNGGGLAGSTYHMEQLLYVFILSFNYISFATLLSFFLKRSGITIGLFLLYAMIIESFLHLMMKHKFELSYGGHFLLLQSSDELLPFPIFDMLKAMAKLKESPAPWTYVLASCCWIILYYVVGRRKLLRSDW